MRSPVRSVRGGRGQVAHPDARGRGFDHHAAAVFLVSWVLLRELLRAADRGHRSTSGTARRWRTVRCRTAISLSSTRLRRSPVFRLPVEGGDYGATFEERGGRRRRRRPAGRRPDDLWWAPLFVAVSPAAAQLGCPQPLRPLAGAADGARRWPSSSPAGSTLGLGTLGLATAAKVYPALLAPPRRPRLEDARPRARGARLRRFVSRRDRGDRHFLRSAVAGWRLGRVLGAGGAPAPDREPRLWDPARRAPALRPRPDSGVEPRLAESRRWSSEDIAVLTTILQVAAVVAVWVWYVRGPADRDGSSAPAQLRSARSSPSGRWSRRNSCSG